MQVWQMSAGLDHAITLPEVGPVDPHVSCCRPIAVTEEILELLGSSADVVGHQLQHYLKFQRQPFNVLPGTHCWVDLLVGHGLSLRPLWRDRRGGDAGRGSPLQTSIRELRTVHQPVLTVLYQCLSNSPPFSMSHARSKLIEKCVSPAILFVSQGAHEDCKNSRLGTFLEAAQRQALEEKTRKG